MKKIAIIWKSSVYHNKFRCSECGAELLDEKGRPNENIIDAGEYLFCRKCKDVVAATKEIETDDAEGGVQFRGEWKGEKT